MLDLKDRGQNPSILSDVVSPVLELRDWLALSNAEVVVGSYSLAAANYPVSTFLEPTTPAGIIVPNNECWYVHSMSSSLFATPATATQVDISAIMPGFRVQDSTSLDAWILGTPGRFMSTIDGFVSGNGGYYRSPSSGRYLAKAGSRFGTFLTADFADATNASVIYIHLYVTKFRL